MKRQWPAAAVALALVLGLAMAAARPVAGAGADTAPVTRATAAANLGEPGRTAADKAPDGAATRPAASTARAAATAPKPKDEEEPAIPPAFIEAARRSFVVVRIHLKKDTSETLGSMDRDWWVSRLYEEYVDQKRPVEMPGLILDDKGHVLTVDAGLEDRFIDRIEVQAGGRTHPARPARLLFDAPGLVLKVDAQAAGLTPLRFAPFRGRGIDTAMLQATLYQVDEQWRLRFGPLRPSVRFDAADGNVYFGHRLAAGGYARDLPELTGTVDLLGDESGSPVGCALASFIDLEQKECLWKGPDLLKAEGLDWPELEAAERACRDRIIAAMQEVVLVLRQGAAGAPESPAFPPRHYGERAAGEEISLYGVAVSPTQVVVFQPMDTRLAAEIERIYVKHSPTQRQDVEFAGAYKDVGAFIVSLPKGRLPVCVELSAQDPARMRPFWAARFRKRFGQKYADLSANRIVGKARGYQDKYHWYAARGLTGGTLLVDLAGRVVGAYAHERMEHEEERRLEAAGGYRGRASNDRIFLVSELRPMLTSPAAHVDARIAVKPKALARRRAWFGVEFVAMTADLAEMMDVEKPTKDGQLGFLVNAVYAGSPAEKMGVKVGDILLRLQGPGMPYPIDLGSRLIHEGYGPTRRWSPGMDEEGEEGEGPVEPTWKNRRSFLTNALDAIGVGKTVRITYCRPDAKGKDEDKTAALDYKIEMAPPDFDSAPKWQNRKLGLTVRDVTYEIRHALGLRDQAAGVVVARVEPGSPTIVAKIFPNEIITRLDDRPLESARHMRDVVAAARKAGKTKVRLTILRLGKTRFADLAVTEYDPADDEGLEEGD